MNMRFLLVLLLLFLLQSVFLYNVSFFYVQADLFFVLVVLVVVLRGVFEGLGYALFFGVIQDLLFSNNYIHTGLLMAFVFAAYFLRKSFEWKDYPAAWALVLVLSPFYSLLQFGVLGYFYEVYYPLSNVLVTTSISTLLNLLTLVLMYPFLARFLVEGVFQAKRSDVITHL